MTGNQWKISDKLWEKGPRSSLNTKQVTRWGDTVNALIIARSY